MQELIKQQIEEYWQEAIEKNERPRMYVLFKVGHMGLDVQELDEAIEYLEGKE